MGPLMFFDVVEDFIQCRYLRANYLQGSIPTEIGNLLHLVILYDFYPFLFLCLTFLSDWASFETHKVEMQGFVKQLIKGIYTFLLWQSHAATISVSWRLSILCSQLG